MIRAFSPEQRSAIRDFHRLEPWRGVRILVFFGLWLAAATVAIRVPMLAVRLACYFMIGATIQGLVILMHEGVHRILFRNRFWTQCWAARYGAPHMSKDGSIVLMSSSQPRKTIPRYSASCAAAGAIEALARILAIELAPIRVNVIAPGFVLTPGTGHIPPERRAAWDRIAQSQPVKRLGDPGEIADGMLFLMENGFATGTVLDIDGGYRFT